MAIFLPYGLRVLDSRHRLVRPARVAQALGDRRGDGGIVALFDGILGYESIHITQRIGNLQQRSLDRAGVTPDLHIILVDGAP